MVGSGLRSFLIETLEPYASDEVVKKIAPCGSTQRNECLNGLIASKNLKIRCYGASESSDYRTAAAICQFNDGVSYIETVCKKLKHHTNRTTLSRFAVKRNLAGSRQSKYSKTKEFKVQRKLRRKNRKQTQDKRELLEGTCYQSVIGTSNTHVSLIQSILEDREYKEQPEV